MKQLWSTDSVTERARRAYWVDATRDTYLPLEFDFSPSDQAFYGRIEVGQLSTLSISKVTTSAQTVRRTSSNIAQSINDSFLVSLQLSGHSLVRQDNRTAILEPGDFVLYSSIRPYELIFEAPIEQLVLMMPASVVRSRLRCADDLTACRAEQGGGAGKLMRGLVQSVFQSIDGVHPTAFPAIAASVENIVIAGLCTLDNAQGDRGADPHLLRREKIKAYVLHNLRDSRLSIDTIVRHLGISPSSIHRAFAQEACTMMAWTWSLRLDGARREMADLNYGHLSITDIAFSWGFSDSSHFSRAFRTRFGCSPRDLRGVRGARQD